MSSQSAHTFSVLQCWIPAHDAKRCVTCQQACRFFLWERTPFIPTKPDDFSEILQTTIRCWGKQTMIDEAGSMPWLGPQEFD